MLQLLKQWTETFKKDTTLGIIEETYETLRKSRMSTDGSNYNRLTRTTQIDTTSQVFQQHLLQYLTQP